MPGSVDAVDARQVIRQLGDQFSRVLRGEIGFAVNKLHHEIRRREKIARFIEEEGRGRRDARGLQYPQQSKFVGRDLSIS